MSTTQTGLPTCYRHPDRETGLSCSECGRPICSHCHSHGFFVADPLGAAPASAASVARKATIAPAFTIPET